MHSQSDGRRGCLRGFLLTQAALVGLAIAASVSFGAEPALGRPTVPTAVVTSSCACGCQQGAPCTCPTCGQLLPTRTATYYSPASSFTSCANGVCSQAVDQSGQVMYFAAPSACSSSGCGAMSGADSEPSLSTPRRFRLFRRFRR